MSIVFKNKGINGLYYHGINYLDNKPSIIHKYDKTLAKKVTPSFSTDATSGYAVTFSFSSIQFRLYSFNDIYKEIDYLPNYKFVLKYGTDVIIDTLVLVYDGDGLFHIEGSINLSSIYIAQKLMTYNYILLCVEDENNEIFLTDTESILTMTVASSTTSVSFTDSTLTSELAHIVTTTKESIELPYSIASAPDVGTGISRYLLASGQLGSAGATTTHVVN